VRKASDKTKIGFSSLETAAFCYNARHLLRSQESPVNLPIGALETMKPMDWHLMLESLADGQVAAWVAELPDCRVIAASKEAAVAALEPLVDQRMATIESVVFQSQLKISGLSEHPAMKFIGVFENDADFADILADMRTERELTDDNPAYT
jgi:hypothetical protein